MTASKAWIGGIFAAVSAGLSALAVVLVGDTTLADVTQAQWLAVIIAVVTAGGGVFGFVYHTTNSPLSVASNVSNGGIE